MIWTLLFEGSNLRFWASGEPAHRRSLKDNDHAVFVNWTRRYSNAVKTRNRSELEAIGREMFSWLEADGYGWGTFLTDSTGEINLDLVVSANPGTDARVFLNLPWELLATPNGGYLAEDGVRHYCVQRRLGEARAPLAPRYQDLAVMFMAAAPRNVEPVLDFEMEEAGILKATNYLPLSLTVEESGCATLLKDRLAFEGPFDIVHLTCHGEIGKDGTMLVLEDEAGYVKHTSAATLSDALGEDKPGLLFLSACRTAESVDHAAPFAVSLLQAGVPTVLGWDGSVHDTDARHFASKFYAELARNNRPALAVAKARQRLLTSYRADARKGQHWHLARLYVLPSGGGELCERNAEERPRRRSLAFQTFLDMERKKGGSAGASVFVGRRRELQDVFRAFRDCTTPGVLIHGFGGHGKSSLAARIADRCPHHKTALVSKSYDAQAVFNAALTAVHGEEAVVLHDTWNKRISDTPLALKEALKTILDGPSKSGGRIVRQPLLLIIDNLEDILDKPTAGSNIKASVKAEFKPVLAAVLEAFETASNTRSRLILTSRYDFALRNASGDDLAARLAPVRVLPFNELERQKQQSATARNEENATPSDADKAKKRAKLLARCRAAAEGNPLVQVTLTHAALTEPETAEAALTELENYKLSGVAPSEGDLGEAFTRFAIDVYCHALSKDEVEAFRALTLFKQPVPESVSRITAALLVHEAAGASIKRLTSLGLLDLHEPYTKDGNTGVSIARFHDSANFDRFKLLNKSDTAEILTNTLVRPRFTPLTEDEERTLAEAALPLLVNAWTDINGNLPKDQRSLEVFRLAVLADNAEVQGNAARQGGSWLFETRHDAREALRVACIARRALSGACVYPDPELLELCIQAANRLGEMTLLDELLAEIEPLKGVDTHRHARLQLYQVDRLEQKGELDEALRILCKEILPSLTGDDWAITRTDALGKLADIIFQHGESDEALRICEEQLLLYEKLGDIGSRASVMSKIAEIRYARSEFNEAFRILNEESLLVFERIGDVRSRSVILGKIADIHETRDEFDQALRIHEEQRWMVANDLNDVDSIVHILIATSRIRMKQNMEDQENVNRVLGDLTRAYEVAKKLARLDFICDAAKHLAQLRQATGAVDLARPLFIEARDGYRKLKRQQDVGQVEASLAELERSGSISGEQNDG